MRQEKSGKLTLSRREFLVLFASLFGGAVLAACEPGPDSTSTPIPPEATNAAKPPSKATQIITKIYEALTQTPVPVKKEPPPTPTATEVPRVDSLIPGLKLRTDELGVNAQDFKIANPDSSCTFITFGGQPAESLHEFEKPDKEYITSALHPEYMRQLLNIKSDKDGNFVGSYVDRDGKTSISVTETGPYQYKDSLGRVFIALLPQGAGFGFVCKDDQVYKYGAVNGQNILATDLWDMFSQPGEIATRFGYTGNPQDVFRVGLEQTMDGRLTGRLAIKTIETTTNLKYVGDAKTEVIPNDPKVEAIRKTVGDQTSDWIKWNPAADAYEVDLVFSGKDAVKKESLPIADGNDNLIGTTLLTCTGQYLIGDQLSTLTFPLYWQEQSTGLVHSWNGGKFALSDIYDSDLTAFSVMNTTLLGGVRWQPGEVIKVYVNKPDKTAVTHKNDFWTPDMAKIWSGKEPDFVNFVTNGVSPGIVIISLTPGTCQPFELKKDVEEWGGFLCKRDTKIVPGY